ncbi:roadblock/LC7 domain-containing protein [Streptomyces sp. NBC_00825]|uniref:roadblock/LC7 domain-containing protein n=1 Tax=unclassified Streptomyces TaxID=2593676 RepID=UPI002ED42303|nr:roadblock/LC7 domain-containing protein [Streptomyces sp. NBC_00826]WTH89025.1 roadblock/LC7 domain-containing protein [Streptomyces sp. NBC_00825]WTH97755.1 roadblock/LC7 domain-containing protein [Streptomyces sp. NBC_00822]
MPDTVPTSGTTLDGLLAGFLSRTPHAHHVVLVAPDGLTIAYADDGTSTSYSAENDGGAEGRLAAAISGLYSLARGILACGVRQIVIEGETEMLFVMSAGSAGQPSSVGTRLGVISGSEADPGVIGWEMAILIKSLDEHLSTKARTGIGQEQ